MIFYALNNGALFKFQSFSEYDMLARYSLNRPVIISLFIFLMIDFISEVKPSNIASTVIGSLIVSIIVLLCVAARKWYKSGFTLIGSYFGTYEKPDAGEFTKSIVIWGGRDLFLGGTMRGRLTLKIGLREEKNFEEINVRFVEIDRERFWKFELIQNDGLFAYKNASQEIVSLINIHDPEEIDRYKASYDRHGGLDVRYSPAKRCPGGGYLWLEMDIKIGLKEGEEWNGYVSFEHRRGGSIRRFVRAPVKIIHYQVELPPSQANI